MFFFSLVLLLPLKNPSSSSPIIFKGLVLCLGQQWSLYILFRPLLRPFCNWNQLLLLRICQGTEPCAVSTRKNQSLYRITSTLGISKLMNLKLFLQLLRQWKIILKDIAKQNRNYNAHTKNLGFISVRKNLINEKSDPKRESRMIKVIPTSSAEYNRAANIQKKNPKPAFIIEDSIIRKEFL